MRFFALLSFWCFPFFLWAQDFHPEIAAMKAFEQYKPQIEATDGPVLMQRSFSGDLNKDGYEDVIIEFGIGAEGGSTVLFKKAAIYLNQKNSMKVVAGFEPDYCFNILKIESGYVVVQELEDCISPFPDVEREMKFSLVGSNLMEVK